MKTITATLAVLAVIASTALSEQRTFTGADIVFIGRIIQVIDEEFVLFLRDGEQLPCALKLKTTEGLYDDQRTSLDGLKEAGTKSFVTVTGARATYRYFEQD